MVKNYVDPTKPRKKEAPKQKSPQLPQQIPQQPIFLMPGQEQEQKIEKTPKATSLSISFDGVAIVSNQLTPKKIEQMADRIIKKHSKFMIIKRKNKAMIGTG